jgi:hypothetical protein
MWGLVRRRVDYTDYGKGKWKQLQRKIQMSRALSPQLPTLPMQPLLLVIDNPHLEVVWIGSQCLWKRPHRYIPFEIN